VEADRETPKSKNGAVATGTAAGTAAATATPASASAPSATADKPAAPAQAAPASASGAPADRPAAPAQSISLSAMKEMNITALTKIGKELDIAGATGMRKQELIFEILRVRYF
jgi:transcription termination factor Rho